MGSGTTKSFCGSRLQRVKVKTLKLEGTQIWCCVWRLSTQPKGTRSVSNIARPTQNIGRSGLSSQKKSPAAPWWIRMCGRARMYSLRRARSSAYAVLVWLAARERGAGWVWGALPRVVAIDHGAQLR